jgi:DNA-binding NarL/FixJ family response regulator
MIDVILIDDNGKIRRTVKEELEQHAELRVVGEASDGLSGFHLALSVRPHVVVMDIGLARLDGIEATRRIKTVAPDIAVIGLSLHQDPAIESAMLEAGAARFLPKDTGLQDLASAIMQATHHS